VNPNAEFSVSNPAPMAERPKPPSDLLEFQLRAAAQGWMVRLPSPDPDWELPDPVDLGGESIGQMVVRLRRAEP
jgi:hypothetical protein